MAAKRTITSAQSDSGTCRVLPDGRAARRRNKAPTAKVAGLLLWRDAIDAPCRWVSIDQLAEWIMAKGKKRGGGGKGRGKGC